MSILLFSTAWLLLASASLWRCGNTTKGEMEEIKGLLKQWFEFLHNGLCDIHSSLKRGSALGPTLPNVLMISMCKECWSWYWGSSRKDANCIFTRSSSYIEHTNERRTVNKYFFVLFFFFKTTDGQLVCVFPPPFVWQFPWWSQMQGWWISSLSWKQHKNKALRFTHKCITFS